MNKICTNRFVLFSFVFCSIAAMADDKIYLNEKLELAPREKAAYYAQPAGIEDGLFSLRVYYLSGSLRMKGQYTDKSFTTEEGYFEYLYINGKPESSGYFKEGRKVGPWARYNWDGSRKPDRIYTGQYSRHDEETGRFEPAFFPGDDEALFIYLAKHINPKEKGSHFTQNQVVHIGFEILPTGEISNVHILKSINPSLDAEAMRVVSEMPNWVPAKKLGVPVESKFVLPVSFAIDF